MLFNVTFFTLAFLGGGSIFLYYSYIAPAKVVYQQGKNGLQMAVGVYDRGKGIWTTGREWYGWLTGEARMEDLPEEVREKAQSGWFK